MGSLVSSYESSYACPRAHTMEINGTGGGYFNDADWKFHRPFDRQVDAVLSALREGREPPAPVRATLRTPELAIAAIRSAVIGRPVDTL